MKRLTYRTIIIIAFLIGIGISFEACKKEEDKPAGTNKISIPETTKVIEKDTWNDNIVNIDTSNYVFTFKDEINSSIDFKPGDIIVSQEGYGYLRKVTKVEEAGSNIKVYTSFASLTDAIENGSFSFREVLSEQKIQEINYLRKGVVLNTSSIKNTDNTALHYDLDTYLDNDEKVHLTGEFVLLPEVFCDYEISNLSVEFIQAEFTVEEGINITADISLLDIQYQNEVQLGQITFQPILVMVGLMPIVVVPELEINAGVILEVHSNVVTNVDQDLNFTAGVLYENQEWTVYEETIKELNFIPPTLSASAEARAYIKPQLNIKIFGIVSPYLQGELFARIDADIDATPWWSIYGGVEAGVGVKVEILGGVLLDYYTNPPLIEYEELVAEAQTGNDETFTDPRDGQEYNIVTIGDQTWFAENLNYETSNSWWYDNNSANGDVYGRLYAWNKALTACPDGWQLPSLDEWVILYDYLGGRDIAGGKMKETGTAHWNTPNTGATNSSGFTGLPGGVEMEGGFYNLKSDGFWWTASEESSTVGWSMRLYDDRNVIRVGQTTKPDGLSVRCIKD